MKVSFSIDLHDNAGDCFQTGILLHLFEKDSNQDRFILRLDSLRELDYFIQHLQVCFGEIQEHHLHLLSEEDQAEYGVD